jgi:hypothetical protein
VGKKSAGAATFQRWSAKISFTNLLTNRGGVVGVGWDTTLCCPGSVWDMKRSTEHLGGWRLVAFHKMLYFRMQAVIPKSRRFSLPRVFS